MKPEDLLKEPPQEVLDAMASERRQQMKRNGHGEYGYREIWMAGVRAYVALVSANPNTIGD